MLTLFCKIVQQFHKDTDTGNIQNPNLPTEPAQRLKPVMPFGNESSGIGKVKVNGSGFKTEILKTVSLKETNGVDDNKSHRL
jgi:hypothetical protein